MRRPSGATIAVLSELLQAREPVWGRAILDSTTLKSGTLYPILRRLEDEGWVSSEWESGQPPGRPRRRYYTLTPDGRAAAVQVIEATTTPVRALRFAP